MNISCRLSPNTTFRQPPEGIALNPQDGSISFAGSAEDYLRFIHITPKHSLKLLGKNVKTIFPHFSLRPLWFTLTQISIIHFSIAHNSRE